MASVLPIKKLPASTDPEAPQESPQHVTPNPRPAIELAAFRPQPLPSANDTFALEILEGPGQGSFHRFSTGLLVGRSPRCDLVIEHPGVAEEHLRLEIRYGRWTAVNQSPESLTLTLKNGSPFQVTGMANGDVFSLGQVQLRLHGITGNEDGSEGSGRREGNTRLLLGAGLGLLLLVAGLFFLLQPSKGAKETAALEAWTKERADQEDLQLRKVSALLLQARRLEKEGQTDQAKSRLNSLMAIDPQNEEAKELLAALQAREKEREQKERERQSRSALVRDAVRPHITEAERLLAAGDITGAQNALARAMTIDPNLPEARAILASIEVREKAAKREAKEPSATTDATRRQLTELEAEAQSALLQKTPYRALVAFRQIADLEREAVRAAAARKKVVELEDRLTRLVAPDIQQARQLQSRKQYVEAYRIASRALAAYPESREALAFSTSLVPFLEQEAKRLYEEGLAEDRQGHRDQALARWRETIKAMPLPDNEYRRLAESRLGQTGTPGQQP